MSLLEGKRSAATILLALHCLQPLEVTPQPLSLTLCQHRRLSVLHLGDLGRLARLGARRARRRYLRAVCHVPSVGCRSEALATHCLLLAACCYLLLTTYCLLLATQ